MYLLVGWRCFIYSGAFFAVFWGHFLEQRTSCSAACHLPELFFSLCLQAKISHLNSAVVVIRVMRDLCNRVPTWLPLLGWVRNCTHVFKKKKNHLHHPYFLCSFLFTASWAPGRKDYQYIWETNGSGRVIAQGFWVHCIGDTLGRCCSELSHQNACSHVIINMKSNPFFSP